MVACAAVLAVMLGAASCTTGDGAEPDEGADAMTADIEPGANSELSAVLSVETDVPTTLEVTVEGPGRSATSTVDDAATSHTVPLVGMRAESTYSVVVEASGEDTGAESVELSHRTGSLPDELPPITVDVAPDDPPPGEVTLFNAMYWAPDDADGDTPDELGFVLGVDGAGEVVWYYRAEHLITDVEQTERGTLLISVDDVVVREIDLLGTTIEEWGTEVARVHVPTNINGDPFFGPMTEQLPIDSAHHEVTELANGHLLTISTEVIELDPAATEGLCDGATDGDGQPIADPTAVVADVVVELDEQREVVRQWRMADYFDPLERNGSDLCTIGMPIAPPNWFYPEIDGLRDWTHANAAVIDEATNTLLVSMRHLDSILAIRYDDADDGAAGEVLWDLSPEGTLEMVDGGEFALHGHAVEPQDDGTILYYDNGNGRAGTVDAGGDTPTYSRAVLYDVDDDTGQVTQLWEHRDVDDDGTPVFSAFLSDVDRLPDDNVLITHGAIAGEDGTLTARLVEVVPGERPDGSGDTIVWDLTIGDGRSAGWTVYRSERIRM